MNRTVHFASDNYAAVHPEVMAAMAAANEGHDVAYGADAATAAFDAAIASTFGEHALGFPVFNGTGANIVSLMALSPRWGGVVASEHAHINVDENGAPERVGGLKVLPLPSVDGRLHPEQLARYAGDLGDEHRAQPVVLSVTQSTELGTVYPLDQMADLTYAAHELGMRVHMDGARIANAAAALGVSLREATAGADILSFGGTKNGAMLGEAVVILAEDLHTRLAHDLPYLRKSTMQLGSKMRYVSAQLTALLTSTDVAGEPLWLRNARHANAMAARLRGALAPLAQSGALRFTQPTESNAVFVELPRAAADAVRAAFRFYDWQPGAAPDSVEARWMCSWDTTVEDVDGFAQAIAGALEAAR
ncbi:beta-eliminating lyase-related protein [Demequina sp. SYSU T00192]|uniref:Beta-eliminating lyase-related protein n=1 Tax=Demequina litoralis TaxID=3051660 RepID=A0ABT8GAB9_9MICO|nr:beta-eliminating lyase-related protein [Demequina sp. SYSU T00192]MDN4476073.1 beta-eliminating lyase-related protein [Demequina sp. SYSU T00192]